MNQNLKLPFKYKIVCDFSIGDATQTRQSRFVVVWLPHEESYATYQVNERGDCNWGHYRLHTLQEAVADMLKRASLPSGVIDLLRLWQEHESAVSVPSPELENRGNYDPHYDHEVGFRKY